VPLLLLLAESSKFLGHNAVLLLLGNHSLEAIEVVQRRTQGSAVKLSAKRGVGEVAVHIGGLVGSVDLLGARHAANGNLNASESKVLERVHASGNVR